MKQNKLLNFTKQNKNKNKYKTETDDTSCNKQKIKKIRKITTKKKNLERSQSVSDFKTFVKASEYFPLSKAPKIPNC